MHDQNEHYKNMLVEPFLVMQSILSPEEYKGFLKGNIIKYAMRQGNKNGTNRYDDAYKCIDYMIQLSNANKIFKKDEVDELYDLLDWVDSLKEMNEETKEETKEETEDGTR